MKLRTIVAWVIYNYRLKYIETGAATKKRGLKMLRRHPGCVLVKLKGHYLIPRHDIPQRST